MYCDGCGQRGPEEFTKASARKTVRARGWLVCHRNGSGIILDYCPACRKEREI